MDIIMASMGGLECEGAFVWQAVSRTTSKHLTARQSRWLAKLSLTFWIEPRDSVSASSCQVLK